MLLKAAEVSSSTLPTEFNSYMLFKEDANGGIRYIDPVGPRDNWPLDMVILLSQLEGAPFGNRV